MNNDAFIVLVNNGTQIYICKDIEEKTNFILLKDCMTLIPQMSNSGNEYSLSIAQPLFINNEELDVYLYNCNNVVYYKADNDIVEKYNQVLIQLKSNIIPVKDIPENYAKNIINLKNTTK